MAATYQKILRQKYTEDYYDPDMNANAKRELPEWKVYFKGGFWGHQGRERAGKEIPLSKEFLWGDKQWLVPAAYSCSEGLVVDFCVRVPVACIRTFMEKWGSPEERILKRFSSEQRMQMETENPLSIEVRPEAIVNGTVLKASRGCSVCWNPCIPESEIQEIEADMAVKHYGLDPLDGWVIMRWSFPWAAKRRAQVKSLCITLRPNLTAIAGPHFRVEAPGASVPFVHPATGQSYLLTVQDYERQEMSDIRFPHAAEMEFPTYYTAMSYAITPDSPDITLTIQDCAEGDQPRRKKPNPFEPEARHDAYCIGIIGGANGVTTVQSGQKDERRLKTACSALHYEPVQDVEWRMVFHEKLLDDVTVEML